MASNYVAQTAGNLRAQWEGTELPASRASLIEAIRFATEHDRDRPSDEDVEAIADELSDLVQQDEA